MAQNFRHQTLFVIVACLVTGHSFADDCLDPDLAKIKKGVKLMLCDGDIVEGTLEEKAPCTADAQQNCYATSVFKAVDAKAIKSGDILIGKTIAGVTGINKVHLCRNSGNGAVYNANTPTTGASVVAGVINVWDTIDDANGGTGFPAALSTGDAWDSTYYCNGTQITEVTNTAPHLKPSGEAIYCRTSGTGTCTNADAKPFTQIFYDAYTGLYLTNVLISSGGAAAQFADWSEAVAACYNLNSGDGTNKWRLPTQKEQVLLHTGGIYALNSLAFGSLLADIFWAATTNSITPTSAWNLRLDSGLLFGAAKNTSGAIMCVR